MGSEMCIRDRRCPDELDVEQRREQRSRRLAEGADEQEMAEAAIHCLLYTSDAADERSSVDLGGRRIIKKKKCRETGGVTHRIQRTAQ